MPKLPPPFETAVPRLGAFQRAVDRSIRGQLNVRNRLMRKLLWRAEGDPFQRAFADCEPGNIQHLVRKEIVRTVGIRGIEEIFLSPQFRAGNHIIELGDYGIDGLHPSVGARAYYDRITLKSDALQE